MSSKSQLKGIIMLSLTAFIWGAAFVAQSVGLDNVGAFTFAGIRTLFGAITLLPAIILKDRIYTKEMTSSELARKKERDKNSLKYGVIIGIVLCFAANFQQFAFYDSTPGKVAFITSLYMFFVPVFEFLMGKKSPVFTWICVGFGFVGLYFLSIDPNDILNISKGDLLALICSIGFAVHIILIGKFVPYCDGVRLSFWQFVVSGGLS